MGIEGEAREHMTLRAATLADSKSVWRWRNDQATREGSFTSGRISYRVHEKWFDGKLKDPSTEFFIVVDAGGRDVGYVRFDISGANAEISVAIDSKERRKGYGLLAVLNGVQQVLEKPSINRVLARIKSGNVGSMSAFKRAGFVLAGPVKVHGIEGYQLVYERTGTHEGAEAGTTLVDVENR